MQEREPYHIVCQKCGRETYLSRSGAHIKLSCVNCGYLKFMPQKASNFHMPFGKYKGMLLTDIKKTDIKYLYWASLNLKENIASKIREVLK